ncbi:PREDICTED: uncharacterized protein LOC105567260 [Vollenhovia emeryi]|uniref:uncharacterized protein LOC105567260 n=1 Tax=Vollenhovia emeryi TaxID=411798 RepID=UPI0005F42569|nr:PREDICTED: uncharacterized protein LOC105567260 [Vollenhovia emeryi]
MTVLKFAEEFTRLVLRYSRSLPNNDPSNDMPLNDEEIIFTIRHVLQVLSIKDVDKNNNTANAVGIPETSLVDIKQESENTWRSEDVLSVCTDDGASLTDTSPKVTENEQENFSGTLQDRKKFISQSNPAICINISRSDTFVHEESQKITEDQDNVFEDSINTETCDLSEISELLGASLNTIRESTMKTTTNITAKLDNIEALLKQLFSKKLPKAVTSSTNWSQKMKINAGNYQSLSNGHSSLRHTPITNKPKVSPNSRKSSSFLPRTSTSSKLSVKENISARRKSTDGIRTNASAEISVKSKVSRSTLNMNTLSPRTKTSPSSSAEFQPKLTKNPKYAHINSIISKQISQKNKIK